jgi:hypothetical protein
MAARTSFDPVLCGLFQLVSFNLSLSACLFQLFGPGRDDIPADHESCGHAQYNKPADAKDESQDRIHATATEHSVGSSRSAEDTVTAEHFSSGRKIRNLDSPASLVIQANRGDHGMILNEAAIASERRAARIMAIIAALSLLLVFTAYAQI